MSTVAERFRNHLAQAWQEADTTLDGLLAQLDATPRWRWLRRWALETAFTEVKHRRNALMRARLDHAKSMDAVCKEPGSADERTAQLAAWNRGRA